MYIRSNSRHELLEGEKNGQGREQLEEGVCLCVCVSVCERVRAHVDSHHLEMVAAAAVVLEFRV